MDKLGIKDDAAFCESICEYKKTDVLNRFEYLNEETKIAEIRVDYLLNHLNEIDSAIQIVNEAKKKFPDKKIIATIRTFDEGGCVYLDKKTYAKYIISLIEKSKADGVDVQYNYFLQNKRILKDVIKSAKKDIILSYHEFCRSFSYDEYENLIKEMSKDFKGIVKVAINAKNRDDVINLMKAAKEAEKDFKDVKYTIIAMGRLGIFSRINYKYTNSKILFINSNRGINVLGQPDLKEFKKLEKLV